MELKQEEIERIELRSNEVQEILSRPPRWIVRWGISIIFIVIAMLIIGSWFFKYPDIITAKVILTTENPPASIIAKTSGKIQNLYVSDNEFVDKDQVLAIIENPAKYECVELLEKQLDLFMSNFKPGMIFKLNKNQLELGNIQSAYSVFYKNMEDYNQAISLNYHEQKIALYQNELKKYSLYLNSLLTQRNLLVNDYNLIRNQFQRDSILHNQKLLSDADFEKSKSQKITKQLHYEQINSSMANVNLQIESLNQNILELKLQKEKQINDLSASIWQSSENLIAAINAWKYQYVLVATTSGKVTFNQYWNENQTVKAEETVLTLIPENEGKIIGKVQLTFQGAGKVKEGQIANIQFSNYPYMEYGMVKGKVNSISLAPNNNYYTAEIDLPNGLKTFYGIDLEFKQEMQGNAEIITEDIRLLNRFIRPLKYILNKNTSIGDLKSN